MVPLRTRVALGGMGVGGTLPESFLRTDAARHEMLGVRWVEVPQSALLVATPGPVRLDVEVGAGQARLFPLPVRPATEVRLVCWLTEAQAVPPEAVVATVSVRLASGRAFDLPLRADLDAPRVAAGDEEGGRRRAVLRLPGRYYVDAVRVERPPGPGRLTLGRLELFDVLTQRATPASPAAAYVSDAGRLREVAAIPGLRLFELPGVQTARVVGKLRVMPTEEAVVRSLDMLPQIGLDPRREALVSAAQAAALTLPRDARASRADLARAGAGRLDVRAEGPGLLVVAEGWDPGWKARVDGRPADAHRVDLALIGVVLSAGTHRVTLSYGSRGLLAGLALAALGAAALAAAAARPAVWREPRGRATVPVPRTMGMER
jgi:hypothetical protein